jgi:hypothetical protein
MTTGSNGPPEFMQLRKGDVLTHVDGEEVTKMAPANVSALLFGEKDSSVLLQISRRMGMKVNSMKAQVSRWSQSKRETAKEAPASPIEKLPLASPTVLNLADPVPIKVKPMIKESIKDAVREVIPSEGLSYLPPTTPLPSPITAPPSSRPESATPSDANKLTRELAALKADFLSFREVPPPLSSLEKMKFRLGRSSGSLTWLLRTQSTPASKFRSRVTSLI